MSDTAAAIRANTKFTPENIPRIVDAVCALLAQGYGLDDALRTSQEYPGLTTWHEWLNKDPDIADKYARAREIQQDFEADNIILIADTDPDAARARNRVEARKWRMSKLAPKKYGDRIGLDITSTRSLDAIDAQIAQLIAAAGIGRFIDGEAADDKSDAAGSLPALSKTD